MLILPVLLLQYFVKDAIFAFSSLLPATRWLLAVYGYCLVLNYFLYISRFLFLFSVLIKSSYTIKVCLLQ